VNDECDVLLNYYLIAVMTAFSFCENISTLLQKFTNTQKPCTQTNIKRLNDTV